MTNSPGCPRCGAFLAADAPLGGLCPACLLTAALDDDASVALLDEALVANLPAGTTVGPFRIVKLLGKGGMAAVYEAHETRLDRAIALKILPPEFLHEEAFARRFQHEARVVANLEHPNIVPIYASGIEDGVPWMSMRLLTGGNLSRVLKDRRLTPDRAVQILRSVADALDYAHAKGIIHRDIKPANILLDRDDRVYVADFGLAQMMEGNSVLTRSGIVMGTPHYMAPEQAEGKGIDSRCDIYSLGIVAYEMLTGVTPFTADSPLAVLLKHVNEPLPIPAPEDMPEPVLNAVKRALAKDPRDRWPSASAFAMAMEKGLSEASIGRVQSRLARAAWPIGLGAAFLLTMGVWAFVIVRNPPSQVAQEVSTANQAQPAIEQPVPQALEIPAIPAAPAVQQDPSASRALIAPRPPRVKAAAAPRPSQEAAGPPRIATPVLSVDEPKLETATPDRDARRQAAVPEERPATAAAETIEAPPPQAPPSTKPAAPSTKPTAADVITQPVRIKTVTAAYPPLARAAQIEGDVLLQATVTVEGTVTDVRVVRSAHPLLDDAARKAVLQYRYTPARRNGVPEAFAVQIPVAFRLQ